MKRNGVLFLFGILGLILITAPFIWLQLTYDFSQGAVSARANLSKGWQFIKNLTPLFIFILFLFFFQRYRCPEKKVATKPSKISNLIEQQFSRSHFHLILFLALAITGFFLTDYTLNLAIFIGLYMIQALGLNIAVGMTGLLVLGYAGFFAVGGYSFALLQQGIPGLTWWMGLPFVIVIGTFIGWLVGLPCLRLRGDYLAIVTLGFAESFRELMRNCYEITGGDKGIRLPYEAKIQAFGPISAMQMSYLVVLIAVFICAILLHRLYHSKIGRAWIAIREDETAASAMGIPVVRMKLVAFMLSSAFAALAGLLYIAYIGFLDPSSCRFEESALVLAMVILGGLGNIPGSLLGSALLYLIPALLRDQFPALADYRLLLFGALMVIMMIYRPQGLLGSPRRRFELKAKLNPS